MTSPGVSLCRRDSKSGYGAGEAHFFSSSSFTSFFQQASSMAGTSSLLSSEKCETCCTALGAALEELCYFFTPLRMGTCSTKTSAMKKSNSFWLMVVFPHAEFTFLSGMTSIPPSAGSRISVRSR